MRQALDQWASVLRRTARVAEFMTVTPLREPAGTFSKGLERLEPPRRHRMNI